jgi:hypothetical protein
MKHLTPSRLILERFNSVRDRCCNMIFFRLTLSIISTCSLWIYSPWVIITVPKNDLKPHFLLSKFNHFFSSESFYFIVFLLSLFHFILRDLFRYTLYPAVLELRERRWRIGNVCRVAREMACCFLYLLGLIFGSPRSYRVQAYKQICVRMGKKCTPASGSSTLPRRTVP